jgi:hypothetical protein
MKTTNMTGLRTCSRGESLAKAETIAGRTIAGSNSDRETRAVADSGDDADDGVAADMVGML